MSDIDMSGITMTPIGDGAEFSGIFDGNHHTISNLNIDLPTTDNVGLIGRLADSVIQNLILHNASVTGRNKVGAFVGGITGTSSSNLFNLQVTGSSTVTGYSEVGGIIGAANSGSAFNQVSRVFSSATVSRVGDNTAAIIGGIAGTLDFTKLQYCASTGQVTAGDAPSAVIGGLVGQFINDSEVMNCYSTSHIVAHANAVNVGGIAGLGRGTSSMLRTFSAVTFSEAGHDAILGTDFDQQLTITFNYFDATVSGASQWIGVGAIDLSNANAKLRASFSGFNFQKHWTIADGAGYPKLVYEPDGCNQVLAHESSGLDRFDDVGDGTIDAPYLICNAAQLNSIGSAGCGASSSSACTKHFILGADIDMSVLGLSDHNRIGTGTNIFVGVFDGAKHTIQNFTINAANANQVGFINNLEPAADSRPVKNLGLVDLAISNGGSEVGGLIGMVNASNVHLLIHSCFVTGAINASGSKVGGLIGSAGSVSGIMVKSVFAEMDIGVSNSSTQSDLGGLVGAISGGVTMTDASYDGSISVSGSGSFSAIGGLFGFSGMGSFSRMAAAGTITIAEGKTVEFVGGVLGGSQSGGNGFSQIRTTMAVAATSQTSHVGGVKGGSPTVGITENLSYIVSLATVTGSPANLGGFIGSADTNYDNPLNIYWDSTRLSQTSSDAANVADMTSVEGRSTADLQNQATYVGWDFTNTWKISAGEYPKLIWQP
jgi:hypothetical protein